MISEEQKDTTPYQIPRGVFLVLGVALGIGISPILSYRGLVAEYNAESISVKIGMYPKKTLFNYEGKYYSASKIRELEVEKAKRPLELNLDKILKGGQK
jgi:hypothetical protein